MVRSPLFDGVDPQLLALIQGVGESYKPYGVNITSGYRQGDPRFHGRGQALDVGLIDRETGRMLDNYQQGGAVAEYQALANTIYQKALQTDPALAAKLRWGGYFHNGGPGNYGALDLMHFDTGGGPGGTGMAGGGWDTGFSPEQMKLWGIQNAGGLGGQQEGPPMPKAPMNYTPEQRRKAIASIESAGSGDYNALGRVLNTRTGTDQALGRYQIMESNLPSWSKQVLGRQITRDEFMADPKLQDAIFDKIFGDYVQKYGEKGAASMWFTGSPNQSTATDIHGKLTGQTYADKYLAALGKPLEMGANYPEQQAPATAGAPAPAGAPPTPGDGLGKALQGVGDALGSTFGAGAAKLPLAQVAKPMATPTVAAPAQTFDTAAIDMQRQKLAEALARLNSGKLFVG